MNDRPLAASTQARCGTLLAGKWTLERVLGSGGMAAVYLGVHAIGRRDAIKILHPHVAQLPDITRRFEQEARAVNQFHHPGAVEIRDVGQTDDGCPFLVMELLDGENLRERLDRQGDLPRAELLRFVDELLDVLVAAHARGIVHRDIKLENLFVTRDGRLKVVDFGIARVATSKPITRIGDVLGTIPYMAPEQVSGEGVDGRTDLFAVGVTMFRALAKRRVHEASSEASMILAMGTEAAPTLRSVAPWVDAPLAAVVDRALRFQPGERFQSASEMQLAIRALRAGPAAAPTVPGAPAPTPIARIQPPPAARRRNAGSARTAIIALSGLVLLLLGVVGFLLLRDVGEGEASAGKKPRKRTASSATPSSMPTPPAPVPLVVPAPQAVDSFGHEALAIPTAVKKRFGAAVRVQEVVIYPTYYKVELVNATDASHLDEFLGRVGARPGEHGFEESGHGSGTPADSAASSFGIDELDWKLVPSMARDASARAEKDSKVSHVRVARSDGDGFRMIDTGPVVVRVQTASKYKSEFFKYDAAGRFIPPRARGKTQPVDP